MRINRNNYEAYLLDLSEGNLSDELRSELSSFMALNPDLEAEIIDDFSTLDSPTDISIDKNLLNFDSINNSNRKHFFIAYHEGDLSSSEQHEVLNFISKNTVFKQEFNAFSKLYLKATTDFFEDKKSLHSIANTSNSRSIVYWSVRIAAILIIGFILNNLYQNATNSIEAKYILSKNHYNIKPIFQNDGKVDFTEFLLNKEEEKLKSSETVAINYKKENLPNIVETKKIDSFNTKETQENSSHDKEKFELKTINKNPSLDRVVATLNQNSNKEEQNTIEPIPVKNIETPPSILAYLGEKAKEKKILSENGRPNIVSLLNKGSNSISGQDILAKSETEESNSTIFKLGSLKIERITKK